MVHYDMGGALAEDEQNSANTVEASGAAGAEGTTPVVNGGNVQANSSTSAPGSSDTSQG